MDIGRALLSVLVSDWPRERYLSPHCIINLARQNIAPVIIGLSYKYRVATEEIACTAAEIIARVPLTFRRVLDTWKKHTRIGFFYKRRTRQLALFNRAVLSSTVYDRHHTRRDITNVEPAQRSATTLSRFPSGYAISLGTETKLVAFYILLPLKSLFPNFDPNDR